jgi:hypothetical protein
MPSASIPCTAPLNIVQNLQTDQICKLKCAYQFTYPPTTLQITNGGSYLLFTPDIVSTPPVIYNGANYSVVFAALVQPSIHQYNGQKADAELIIAHTPSSGSGNLLNVCMPVKASSSSTAASVSFFDMILSTVSQTAASSGQRTIFNNSTFTFGRFVPMVPYYSYSGTNMFSQSCNSREGTTDYLVYHAENSITMSPTAFSTLKRVIPAAQSFGVAIPASSNPGGLFFNPNGPTPPNQPDIYIDCQPTGDDGEILVAAKGDTGSLFDNKLIKDLMNSKLINMGIKIMVGLVLMIFLWMVMVKIVQGVTGSAVNLKPMPATAKK